jgi:hypothetical protein
MEKVAAALYSANLALLLSFHLLDRRRSVLADAVSGYGLGRTAGLFRVYVALGSLAALVLAWVLWHLRPDLPPGVTWSLVAMAGARIGVGLVPTDPPGAAKTVTGRVHLLAAVLTFTFAYMAIAKATPVLLADIPLLGPLRTAAMIGLGGVVLTLAGPLRPFFGLAERLFLFATALWFLVASLAVAFA